MANSTACVRHSRCSFARILLTCVLAVRSLGEADAQDGAEVTVVWARWPPALVVQWSSSTHRP
jgi:hypothetical protein